VPIPSRSKSATAAPVVALKQFLTAFGKTRATQHAHLALESQLQILEKEARYVRVDIAVSRTLGILSGRRVVATQWGFLKRQNRLARNPRPRDGGHYPIAEAKQILAQQGAWAERKTSRLLDLALASSTVYDQKWRRLKELVIQYPRSDAAKRARRLPDSRPEYRKSPFRLSQHSAKRGLGSDI
jgi:hypothetical protein